VTYKIIALNVLFVSKIFRYNFFFVCGLYSCIACVVKLYLLVYKDEIKLFNDIRGWMVDHIRFSKGVFTSLGWWVTWVKCCGTTLACQLKLFYIIFLYILEWFQYSEACTHEQTWLHVWIYCMFLSKSSN
jgi:hypothetical protein